MSCDQVKNRLALFLYEELTFEEGEAIERHLEDCQGCRAALEREKALHTALDQGEANVPAGLLAECRGKLRAEIAGGGVQRGWFGRLWDWLGQPAPPALLRPAGALALVALGFFAARLTPFGAPKSSSEQGPVATQVRYLQPDAAGGVQIGVDETRQRILTGRLGEAAIQQLLLAAAQDAADPGLRLDSVEMLRSHNQSPEVHQALLRTIQHDPNAGVRLKAIEGLKPYSGDPGTRAALAKVLLSDDNLGVRTQAIDLLVQHKGMALAGVFQELMEKEDNSYIRQRCQTALEEMNASLEPF
jgi:hypothetical protein